LLKKLIAYFVIPHCLGFLVYSFGSDHFSSLFTGYYLDIDVWQAFVITALGFLFRSLSGIMDS
jgi:FtsH-binding integral membrane protein